MSVFTRMRVCVFVINMSWETFDQLFYEFIFSPQHSSTPIKFDPAPWQ